jgi:hypothetical protein
MHLHLTMMSTPKGNPYLQQTLQTMEHLLFFQDFKLLYVSCYFNYLQLTANKKCGRISLVLQVLHSLSLCKPARPHVWFGDTFPLMVRVCVTSYRQVGNRAQTVEQSPTSPNE